MRNQAFPGSGVLVRIQSPRPKFPSSDRDIPRHVETSEKTPLAPLRCFRLDKPRQAKSLETPPGRHWYFSSPPPQVSQPPAPTLMSVRDGGGLFFVHVAQFGRAGGHSPRRGLTARTQGLGCGERGFEPRHGRLHSSFAHPPLPLNPSPALRAPSTRKVAP